jgi:hypothetical protein
MTRFTELLNQLKNAPTPNKIAIGERPEMTIGGKPIRIGVYTQTFENLMERVKRA